MTTWMTYRRRNPAGAAALGTLTLIGAADTSRAAVTTTGVSVSAAGRDTNGVCDVFARRDGF